MSDIESADQGGVMRLKVVAGALVVSALASVPAVAQESSVCASQAGAQVCVITHRKGEPFASLTRVTVQAAQYPAGVVVLEVYRRESSEPGVVRDHVCAMLRQYEDSEWTYQCVVVDEKEGGFRQIALTGTIVGCTYVSDRKEPLQCEVYE